MSVVKQKYLSISGKIENLDKALSICASQPNFFIDNPPESVRGMQRAIISSEPNPYLSLKNRLDNIIGNLSADLNIPKAKIVPTSEVYFEGIDKLNEFLSEKENKLNEFNDKCNEYKKSISEDEKIIEQLLHLKNIDTNLLDIFSFQLIKVRFGFIPRENYDKLNVFVKKNRSVIFIPSSVEDDFVWGMYFTVANKAAEADAIFSSLHFKRIIISEKATKTPLVSSQEMLQEINETKKKYEEERSCFMKFGQEMMNDLYSCREYISHLSTCFEMKRKTILTNTSFTFCGYVPVKKLKSFSEQMENIGVVSEETLEDNEILPPVLLDNPPMIRPFQDFVEMYGLPSYNEVDPTPMVAISYSLFFGMMFGDVGQGAVLIIAGLIMNFLMKMNLGKIVSTVGIFSTIFGFVYGSVFGNDHLLSGYKPMENINTTLLAAVGLGVIMISLCSVVNIINGIKQKNLEKLFFSPNGIAGIIFYWSVLILTLISLKFVKLNLSTTLLVTIIIVSLVLIFLKEPLGSLISKKKEWLSELKPSGFVEKFFELCEVVLTFLTNTISFIRIGAFALSHAGMMSVVYLLAKTSQGTYNPIVLVIGNIVVIGLEGMIVGIQVLRLEFYELFSRFFEGDGRKFIAAKDLENENNK